MNWKNIKLGDAATFVNGYAFKPKDWSNSGKEIIRIQNLTGKGSDINFFQGEIDEKYRVTNGDLLISWSATLGIFEWAKEDAWLNQHIFKVVFNKKEFDKTFFKYLISSVIKFFEQRVHGSTMKHITKGNFDAAIVPYPPIEEQKRIAMILDKADALRQKNKQLLAAYDELLQSTFLEMFGDPVTNPKGWDKSYLQNCYPSPKSGTKCGPFGSALKKHEYTDTGIPVWTMDNIQPNRFVDGKSLYISENKYDDLLGYKTEKNDVIISRAGTVGKMCIIPYDGKAIISTNLIRLRLNKNVLRPIYFTTLMSNWGPKVARLKTGRDDSFTHMNTGILNKIELPIPPIRLQNQFSQIVENIEAQKSILKQSIQESEDLFNGLVQKAFKGELNEQ